MTWREVSIGPLKYSRTAAHPKEEEVSTLPRELGWVEYDLRDTQRIGLPSAVEGLVEEVWPQPILEPYHRHFSMAFCSNAGVHRCREGASEQGLRFELPPEGAAEIAHAQLVYDTRGDGEARLEVNGEEVGVMPGAGSVPAAHREHWLHRWVAVAPELLLVGENRLRVLMEGNVQMDRLAMEVGYGPAAGVGELGSISPEGMYRAPEGVAGPVVAELLARSVADTASYGVARVTILPAPQPEPTLAPISPTPGFPQPAPGPGPLPSPEAMPVGNDPWGAGRFRYWCCCSVSWS